MGRMGIINGMEIDNRCVNFNDKKRIKNYSFEMVKGFALLNNYGKYFFCTFQ